MFEGSIVALVTPFRNGRIDHDALATLVERQVAGGTSALVACGTTGEAPTLSEHEHAEVIATVVKLARGRLPVIAGTGTYDTAETIRRTQAAAAAGCRGAMIVTPYYNKPTVRGLRAHFLAVADASSIPTDSRSRKGLSAPSRTTGSTTTSRRCWRTSTPRTSRRPKRAAAQTARSC